MEGAPRLRCRLPARWYVPGRAAALFKMKPGGLVLAPAGFNEMP